MIDQHKFAVLLARLIDLLRRDHGAVEDYKTVLRWLTELSSQGSATIALRDGVLSVEGTAVPPEVPLVGVLVAQMAAHRVAEVHIAHQASAFDLVHVSRALAAEHGPHAPGDGIEDRLRHTGATSVWIVTQQGQQAADMGRAVRISDVLTSVGIVQGGGPRHVTSHVVPGNRAVYQQLADSMRASGTPLSNALQRLEGNPTGPGVPDALGAFISGVEEAVERGRVEEAVAAIVAIVRREALMPEGDLRRPYSIALRRVFTPQTLRAAVKLLLDPLYGRDVIEFMSRAGPDATELLLDLLAKAPTRAERRALLEALRAMKEDGKGQLVSMLTHPEWFVVRNVADLIGEMRIEAAVDPLGKVFEHTDARVRRAAGVALAKIGTPSTARYLRKALRDADGQVRLDTAKAIGGKGVAGLAAVIAGAYEGEPDATVGAELYRALGRIGTAEAVQTLRKAAEPGGRFLDRRPAGPRLAAIEGLALAGGPVAVAALRELSKERDKDIRMAALKALTQAINPGTSSSSSASGSGSGSGSGWSQSGERR